MGDGAQSDLLWELEYTASASYGLKVIVALRASLNAVRVF
jgi:hypothetical protein